MMAFDFSGGFARVLASRFGASRRVALGVAVGFAIAMTAAVQPASAQPAATGNSSVNAPAQSAPVKPDPAPRQDAAPSPESSAGHIVEAAPKPALALEGQSTWDESYSAIAKAFQRLKAETERAGLKPAGKPVAVFLFTDDTGFRFRAMTPLAEEPSNPSLGPDFSVAKTPAGRAVKFEHRGPYDEIDATYEAITAWLDDRNLLAEDFFVEEWVAEGSGAGDVEGAVDVYVFIKK